MGVSGTPESQVAEIRRKKASMEYMVKVPCNLGVLTFYLPLNELIAKLSQGESFEEKTFSFTIVNIIADLRFSSFVLEVATEKKPFIDLKWHFQIK